MKKRKQHQYYNLQSQITWHMHCKLVTTQVYMWLLLNSKIIYMSRNVKIIICLHYLKGFLKCTTYTWIKLYVFYISKHDSRDYDE